MSNNEQWRDDLDDANNQCSEIMSEIQELSRLKRANASETAKTSAKLRKMFVNLGSSVRLLEDSVHRATQARTITEREGLRRQDQVNTLKREQERLLALMRKASEQEGGAKESDKEELISGANNKKRVWGAAAAAQETEQTRLLDNQGVLQYQTTLMHQQDDQVEILHSVIQKQKHIAIAISSELDDQSKLLDNLNNSVDNTENNIRTATRKLFDVSTQEGKQRMSMCCICILLLILTGVLILVLLL